MFSVSVYIIFIGYVYRIPLYKQLLSVTCLNKRTCYVTTAAL